MRRHAQARTRCGNPRVRQLHSEPVRNSTRRWQPLQKGALFDVRQRQSAGRVASRMRSPSPSTTRATANNERTVRLRGNRHIGRANGHSGSLEAPVAHCPCRAAVDRVRNRTGVGGCDVDPQPCPRLEGLRQAVNAIAGVGSQPRLPVHLDRPRPGHAIRAMRVRAHSRTLGAPVAPVRPGDGAPGGGWCPFTRRRRGRGVRDAPAHTTTAARRCGPSRSEAFLAMRPQGATAVGAAGRVESPP